MKNSSKHFTIFFVLLILVSIFSMIYYAKTRTEQNMATSINAAPNEPTPIPTIALVQQTTKVNSSDGTKKLLLTSETTNDTTMYFVFVVDIETGNQELLWSSTEDVNTKISAPKNAWSPDNKYFYLLDNQQDIPHPYVFNATGQAFTDGEIYLDVFPLFAKRQSTYSITDATGWASETLLYIKTAKGNEKGPTFWFEIPSRNFLQLSG